MGSSSSKPARKLAKDAASSIGTPLKAGTQASRPVGASQTDGAQQRPLPPKAGLSNNDRPAAIPRDSLNTTGMRGAEASETKTKAVQQDGQDPHLLANLQKLGAVQVPRGKISYQRSNPMLNILSARQRNADVEREAQETAARQGTDSSNTTLRNRMSVSTIIAMLDARKECRSTKDLEALARGYDIDLDLLQRLALHVNAPSVDASARARRRQLGVKVEENEEVSVMPDVNRIEGSLIFSVKPMERVDAIWTEPSIEDVKQLRG